MTVMEQSPSTGQTPSSPELNTLNEAVKRGREGLLRERQKDGHWCYPVESDATVPAEHILMMHFMDEIDDKLSDKLCNYLLEIQMDEGGWTLYYGGEIDMSCSVKAYYALKLSGHSPDEPCMKRARETILAHGGAARVNVFALIDLWQFEQLPDHACPYLPPEMILLPNWSPVDLSKFSYWARTTIVPLTILMANKARARNPRGINIRELFVRPPEQEPDFFPGRSVLNRVFKGLEWTGRRVFEPVVPSPLRQHAMRRAEEWMIERLNGEGGIGAIFPAMKNAYEALAELGYAHDHPYRVHARQAILDLVEHETNERAFTQPCLSPIWDTALATHALQQSEGLAQKPSQPVIRALDWLTDRQILVEPGDWRDNHPNLRGGGWAFQYRNDYYPDLDDSCVVAWAMHNANHDGRYSFEIRRATDWLCGMQSSNGGFAAFDSDNNKEYLNEIPFADHKSQLDPPTADVTARLLTLTGILQRDGDEKTMEKALAFLKREQEEDGSWFGRWGTNYVYGTWSALQALAALGEDPRQSYIQRAIHWLEGQQNEDGGWGEDNGSYFDPPRGDNSISTTFQTAWALMGLMAWGEYDSPTIRRGIGFLLNRQDEDGLWWDKQHTAPGFPAFFYLKYHGYTRYFPLWALARYRNLKRGDTV